MRFSAYVISGDQIAQKFGIPTANLDVSDFLEPKESGVFATEIFIGNDKYQGVLFIGYKHFPQRMFIAEVFIFDFEGDLYGQEVEVETWKFIRHSQKFETPEELFAMIRNDIVCAKKFFLRRDVFSQWREVSSVEISKMVQRAIEKLSVNSEFLKTKNILIFAPINKEIPFTEELTREFPDKTYFFPKIIKNEIRFFESNFSDLKKDKFDISTPSKDAQEFRNQRSMAIIPAVAADKKGNRLGRGGGFYDRFLVNFPDKKIVVLPKFAIVDSIPVEDHDIPVDLVLTISI
jgi:5,10-methenyltetrahydrofolate synthetase